MSGRFRFVRFPFVIEPITEINRTRRHWAESHLADGSEKTKPNLSQIFTGCNNKHKLSPIGAGSGEREIKATGFDSWPWPCGRVQVFSTFLGYFIPI